MIRSVLTQDDEFSDLRKPCVPVEEFGAELQALIADMWDTMYAAHGVGLAATQIGSPLRVAVIDTLQSQNSNRRLVLVNPHIELFSGEQTSSEGCLSMPGLRWPITRAKAVIFSYQDARGNKRNRVAHDLLARAVQHEVDHLNGILCNSKASTLVAGQGPGIAPLNATES